MGETGVHIEVAVLDLLDVIRRFYDPNLRSPCIPTCSSTTLRATTSAIVCPDLFVALGVPSDINRRSFKVWIEGKVPELVIEVTSKKTRREDQGKKFELYRDVLESAGVLSVRPV